MCFFFSLLAQLSEDVRLFSFNPITRPECGINTRYHIRVIKASGLLVPRPRRATPHHVTPRPRRPSAWLTSVSRTYAPTYYETPLDISYSH